MSENFQQRVGEWLTSCFREAAGSDKLERIHRFLEESLELVQSLGCTKGEAELLVDYVFNRPVGEPLQELGGTMTTLAALSNANGFNMQEAGEIELKRMWRKIKLIRKKRAEKPKGSPLPQ